MNRIAFSCHSGQRRSTRNGSVIGKIEEMATCTIRHRKGHTAAGGYPAQTVNLMNRDRKETRRKSMLGTALFALGIVAGLSAVITGSIWMMAAAVAFLVPGILMLYQSSARLILR